MPEIIPEHVPSPRTLLAWDGTAYRAVRGHTDGTVQVRGEDQLFSFHDTLEVTVSGNPLGANGYLASGAVPAGEVWVVTNVVARDQTTALTAIGFTRDCTPNIYSFGRITEAIPANEQRAWGGHVYLKTGDLLRIYFIGALGTDTCDFWATGYIMTLEV